MNAQFENERAVSQERARLISDLDHIFKRPTVQVYDHEFAMYVFASGNRFATPEAGDEISSQQTPEGGQRQRSGLASDPFPGELVRLELNPKSAPPDERKILA